MSNVMAAYHSAREKTHGPPHTVYDSEIGDAIRAEVLAWIRSGSPYFNLPMIPKHLRDRIAMDTELRLAEGWSEG